MGGFGNKLTPIEGEPRPKFMHLISNHYRGFIGFIGPFILFFVWVTIEETQRHKNLQFMWVWIAWYFLWQPVVMSATGLIPIFFLPMFGILSTTDTALCYMEDSIMLFLLANMLLLLLNNSGFDRRLILWFMCPFEKCSVTPTRLILKCSLAAFFSSMFCNRLLVASNLITLITEPLMTLQTATAEEEPNYETLRYILINAIHTSCTIGSLAVLHSSYTILTFKAMFQRSAPVTVTTPYPDIFNYLDYSAFAFPATIIMFLVNFCYHMVLAKYVLKKKMSPNSTKVLREAIMKNKSQIPKRLTAHEQLSLIFTLLFLLAVFSRWSRFLTGWADFSKTEMSPGVPGVKDATTAAIFVIILHILPKSINFRKVFKAKRRVELPPPKPESAILWWRFVNKNMNYGYIFLLGSGVALTVATNKTTLAKIIADNSGKLITDLQFHTGLLVVIFLSILLANITSGVAACIIFLPWVLAMSSDKPVAPDATPESKFILRAANALAVWHEKRFMGALAVGMATSFEFMNPCLYTPAYYGFQMGKMPKKELAKYGLGTAIICGLVLWIMFVTYAPILWSDNAVPVAPSPLELSETPTMTEVYEISQSPQTHFTNNFVTLNNTSNSSSLINFVKL